MESHKKVHLMNKTRLLQIFGFPALFTFDIAIGRMRHRYLYIKYSFLIDSFH